MAEESEIKIKKTDLQALQFIQGLRVFGESIKDSVDTLGLPDDVQIDVKTPEAKMIYLAGQQDAVNAIYTLFEQLYLNQDEKTNQPKRVSKRSKK